MSCHNETVDCSIAGLTLLGFKPRSSLKRYHHVRPAQFIYPDEKVGCCNMYCTYCTNLCVKHNLLR
jgi:hypothetical protein